MLAVFTPAGPVCAQDAPRTGSQQSRAIDTADWPGHVARFSGPGDVYDLADAVLVRLRRAEPPAGQPDARPMLAAVRGDWSSHRQDVLGQTTQWALPAAAAYELEPGGRVVRVYQMLMLTEQSNDVAKAPPFASVEFGDHYDMLRTNLPSKPRRPDPQSTFMWLLLALGNGAAGFLAARRWLEAKIPSLGGLYQVLAPHAQSIGLAVLIVGGVSLIESLLSLSLFSNILPVLSAIVVGLLLSIDVLLRTPRVSQVERFGAPPVEGVSNEPAESPDAGPAERAGRKAGLFARHLQHLLSTYRQRLDAAAVPIGLCAMGLGVLHLLIGSVLLF